MTIGIEREKRPRADGRCVIYLRVYHHKLRRLELNVRVKPADWSDRDRRVKPNATNAIVYNRAIASALSRAEAFAAERQDATADDVIAYLLRPVSTGKLLSDAIEEVLTEQASRFSELTKTSLRTVVKDVGEYLAHARLDGLSPADVNGYREALSKRGLAQNTIRSRLRRLRILYRHACTAHEITPTDAFRGAIPSEVEVPPKYLTTDQLDRLATGQLPKYLELARDAYLLSVHLGGMRFGDLARLRPSHVTGGAVDYTMGKTDRPKWVPLSQTAKDILAKYQGGPFLLPIISADTIKQVGNANGTVNRHLKLIAATLGLPPGLSTHWARHTFAHMASRSGIPANDIRMILGHSTLGTTTRYLARFDRSAVTDAIAKLFG